MGGVLLPSKVAQSLIQIDIWPSISTPLSYPQVTPVFGQGANSSLESGQVLGVALKEAGGDLAELPTTFDRLRRPDAHGLYEIDRKAFRWVEEGRVNRDVDVLRRLMS